MTLEIVTLGSILKVLRTWAEIVVSPGSLALIGRVFVQLLKPPHVPFIS